MIDTNYIINTRYNNIEGHEFDYLEDYKGFLLDALEETEEKLVYSQEKEPNEMKRLIEYTKNQLNELSDLEEINIESLISGEIERICYESKLIYYSALCEAEDSILNELDAFISSKTGNIGQEISDLLTNCGLSNLNRIAWDLVNIDDNYPCTDKVKNLSIKEILELKQDFSISSVIEKQALEERIKVDLDEKLEQGGEELKIELIEILLERGA